MPHWLSVQIDDLKQKYISNRYLFIKGEDVLRYITYLGATEPDIESLKVISKNLVSDPTLSFRKSRNGRFLLDFDIGKVSRLEFQPFILSHKEDFLRFDSDSLRSFDEIKNDLQLNTAFQALLYIKALLITGVETCARENLIESTNKKVCTIFNLRTVTNPTSLGHPALEGVHSDGVDHTMTTMLGASNMTQDSAITYIHDIRETNGTAWNRAKKEYAIGHVQHRQFLDTLLIADNERKHSLSPVYASMQNEEATRDMLIFFTRMPTNPSHNTHPYDSLNHHNTLPMKFHMSFLNSKS